jgi:hypothetical protein
VVSLKLKTDFREEKRRGEKEKERERERERGERGEGAAEGDLSQSRLREKLQISG